VTQATPQTLTLQRPLAPSKSPVNMPITLAPSGTVSATVPTGGHVVTNIAPAPVAAAASKGLHSTTQAAGESLFSGGALFERIVFSSSKNECKIERQRE